MRMFVMPGVSVGPCGLALGPFCGPSDERARVVPTRGRFHFRLTVRPTLLRTQSHSREETEGRCEQFCKLKHHADVGVCSLLLSLQ